METLVRNAEAETKCCVERVAESNRQLGKSIEKYNQVKSDQADLEAKLTELTKG